jgi:glucose-1-phosphate thymidylyltransferase
MWGEGHRGGALMRAVILAGGKGERLRPLTDNTRKAYLPLGEKRIIDHIIDSLPVGMRFEITEDDTGAASAISHAIKEIEPLDQPILVIGGDNYFSVTLHSFISVYDVFTQIGVYDVGSLEKAKNYGVVKFYGEVSRRISSFQEKPQHPAGTFVSMGLYIFPPSVFDIIHKFAVEKPTGNSGEIISRILDSHAVYGELFGGAWFDIGTIESYQEAQDYIRRQSSVKKHQHKLMLQCDGKEDIVYCVKCGMSTPPMPHDDSASMEEMFQKAEAQGTLGYNEDLKGKGIPGIVSIDEL